MLKDDHDFYVTTRNAAKCNKCGDEIESVHRHDFNRCTCGAIAVDGGTDYLKRAYTDRTDILELSERRRFTEQELREKIAYYSESNAQYGGGTQSNYSYWMDKVNVGERLLADWYPTTGVTDLLSQPISIGDYVVFTNCIYVVKGLPARVYDDGYGVVQLMLASPSKTTRPVKKYSKQLIVVNKQQVEAKLAKR